MPLASSCLESIGSPIYVRPYHGWGWRRDDDPSVVLNYAVIDEAGGFSFTVADIGSWGGELRHVIGRVSSAHSLFAGCWIACAVMHVGTFDFRKALCLRYDLSIGLSAPVGEWPKVASGSPIYGGYGTLGESQEVVDHFMASLSGPKT